MSLAESRSGKSVLESGAIIMPGGCDVDGNRLIVVPTIQLELLNQWRVDDLAAHILYLHTVNRYMKSASTKVSNSNRPQGGHQVAPLTCVADLRQASSLATHHLVDCLEAVEHQRRGTIGAVYFLKPRNTTKSATLKKLLGVKPSKKRPRIPLFKIVLVKTVHEMYSQVDLCDLTPDFQGTRSYSHEAWLHIDKMVVRCIQTCQDLTQELTSVKDKVDLMGEYETEGQSSSQLQQLLADLSDKFQITISESRLPSVLTQAKQTLFSLDNPSSGSHLANVHQEVLEGLKLCLGNLYSELDKWNKDLEESWRKTESKLTVLCQVHRHRERAREIESKITEHYQPLLREHPIIGKTLSQAELYRAHFTTTLYEPAKELLSQATEILMVVQKLHTSRSLNFPASQNPRAESEGGGASIDVSDISRCLTTSIQPFTSQLQHLQQMYVSIHIFHLLFEKTLNWYKKALKFLPDSMVQKCSIDPNSQLHEAYRQGSEIFVYMPAEWLSAVRVFLMRHPPPKEEHLERLDMNTPQMVDRRLRSQARSLALRLRLLQRVLSSTRLPLRLVKAVVSWKSDLFGSSSHQHKSPTDPVLSKLDDYPSRNPTDGPLFVDTNVYRDLPFKMQDVGAVQADSSRLSAFQKAATTDFYVPQGVTPASSNASSLGTSYTGTDCPEDTHAIIDAPPQRKTGNRTMNRTKSVEFNFNSSSTDGSVFDYDKALAGVRQVPSQTEGVLRLPHAKPPRKPRRADKAARLNSLNTPGKYTLDDRTLSDQTTATRPFVGHFPRGITEEIEGFRDSSRVDGSDINNADKYATSDANGENQLFVEGASRNEHLRDIEAQAPNAQERFVRLTFTPKHSFNASGDNTAFNYEFADKLAKDSSVPSTEVESGIDTMELNDTDDSVVKKIREISSSDVSNSEKLQKVSELLSNRTGVASNVTPQQPVHTRLSYSTFDLRHVGRKDRDELGFRSSSPVQKDSVGAEGGDGEEMLRERPVEVVKKMKQNLAKSMEELNTILTQSSHRPSERPAVYTVSRAPNSREERYVSRLKFQPRYNANVVSTKRDSVNEMRKVPSSMNNISERHRLKSGELNRLGATDSDSSKGTDIDSETKFTSSTLKDDVQKRLGSRIFATEYSKSENELPRRSLDDFESVPSDSTIEAYNTSQSRISRPTSLSLPGGNFISPSFLRTATSMRDISSAGAHSLSLDLMKESDLDADFETLQALEDIEVLRSIQQDLSSVPEGNRVPMMTPVDYDSQSEHNPEAEDEFLDYNRRDIQRNEYADYQRDEYHSDEYHSEVDASAGPNRDIVPERNRFDSTTYRLEMDDPYHRWPVTSGMTMPSDDLLRKDLASPGDDYYSEESEEERATPTEDYYKIQDAGRLDRLTIEAEEESANQEEVASTLLNIQHLLSDAESRRRRLMQQMSSVSIERDEEEVEGSDRGRLSHTTSVDNGYGSWASKLISAHSSSSEGAVERETALRQGWRMQSQSSTDSGEQTAEVADQKRQTARFSDVYRQL